MSRFKFYIMKARFLAAFIWGCEWGLVRDEWNMTYGELEEAMEAADKIMLAAIERILQATEEEECPDSNSTSTTPSS